jgi:hypothetical protein
VALKLEECNTLVRGNFNPHIVTPEWLAQQELWQPSKAEVALAVLARGLQFRGDDIEWAVDSDRLLVSSVNADCGKLASRVLVLLPHTPVRAVGSNFTFVGEKDDWGTSPVPMLGDRGPDAFPDDQRPEQVRWMATIPSKEVRTEITVVFGEDGVAVRLNFHRPVSHGNDAVVAAEQFMHDKKRATELLKQFVNQEI